MEAMSHTREILDTFTEKLNVHKERASRAIEGISLDEHKSSILERALKIVETEPYMTVAKMELLWNIYGIKGVKDIDNIALYNLLTGNIGVQGVMNAYKHSEIRFDLQAKIAYILQKEGLLEEPDLFPLGVGRSEVKQFDNMVKEVENVWTDGTYHFVFENDRKYLVDICENFILGNRNDKEDIVYAYPQKNIIVYEYLF